MVAIKEWIKKTEENIEKLEAEKPSDRLDLLTAIKSCWLAVHGSQMGWAQWLQHTKFINKWPEQDLRILFESFRGHATAFLRFDIKASQRAEQLGITDPSDNPEQRNVV